MNKPKIYVSQGAIKMTLKKVAEKANESYITIYQRYKTQKKRGEKVTVSSLTSKDIKRGRPVTV